MVDLVECVEIVGVVIGVIDDLCFVDLFGDVLLVEVLIVVMLVNGIVVLGMVDWLLIEDICVWVIDFKIGWCVLCGLDEVLDYYLK